MATSTRRLRQSLVAYAFACACLATLGVGTVMVTWDRSLNLGDILSSVGLNLIASVIVAVVFSAASSRVQGRAIEENLEEEFGRLSQHLVAQTALVNSTFLPQAVYPPLDPRSDFGDNAPVEMITYDQRTHQLYAGTDFGVFYLKNGKKNWARLGIGLPNTPVLDIKITGDGHSIYAATFGRSVWKLSIPEN